MTKANPTKFNCSKVINSLLKFQCSTEDHEVSNDGMVTDNSEPEDGRDNVTCEGIVNNIAVVFKGVQNDSSDVQR